MNIESEVFVPKRTESSQNPFGHAALSSDKPLKSPSLQDIPDEVIVEDSMYDTVISNTSFTDLRSPMHDIIKFLIYTQYEVYEYAQPYYEQILKKMYNGVLKVYETYLNEISSVSRVMGLQILFEFECLLDLINSLLDKNEIALAKKCKQRIYGLFDKDNAKDEGQVLSGEEIGEKNKQIKAFKARFRILFGSFE